MPSHGNTAFCVGRTIVWGYRLPVKQVPLTSSTGTVNQFNGYRLPVKQVPLTSSTGTVYQFNGYRLPVQRVPFTCYAAGWGRVPVGPGPCGAGAGRGPPLDTRVYSSVEQAWWLLGLSRSSGGPDTTWIYQRLSK